MVSNTEKTGGMKKSGGMERKNNPESNAKATYFASKEKAATNKAAEEKDAGEKGYQGQEYSGVSSNSLEEKCYQIRHAENSS